MGAGYPEVVLAEVLVAAALVEVGREMGCCDGGPSVDMKLPFP